MIYLSIPLVILVFHGLIRSNATTISKGRNRGTGIPRDGQLLERSFMVMFNNHQIRQGEYISKIYDYLLSTGKFLRDVQIKEIKHLFHGAIITGLTKEEIDELPIIVDVIPDRVREFQVSSINHPQINSQYGLDRLDQLNLPFDGLYNHLWAGSDVDMYIVDTGIDTSHEEFQPTSNSTRIVKNVFDGFIVDRTHPDLNNDENGHGTHVAGTAGGNSLGVSPDANIFGVKIFRTKQTSMDTIIAEAFDHIIDLFLKRKRRTVVNMSFGRVCDFSTCQNDFIMKHVEKMISKGIIVVVSAGNDGCNACHQSPAAATNAITVGASDWDDAFVSVSNFGRCVDIIAPGANIKSACNYNTCRTFNNTFYMSGTSMAAPHVTGIIAQILQKLHPYYMNYDGSMKMITPDNIKAELTCSSNKGKVTLLQGDSVTKNLLLHIPNRIRNDNPYYNAIYDNICHYANDCGSNCLDHGICLRHDASVTYLTDSYNYSTYKCYCDKGYYGSSCTHTYSTTCKTDEMRVIVNKIDRGGDGWNHAKISITDIYGMTVGDAYDSMCSGSRGNTSVCLSTGIYEFVITSGSKPNEIIWNTCNNTIYGSAPYYGLLKIQDTTCTHMCPTGYTRIRADLSSGRFGWKDAYFMVRPENHYDSLYGGTTFTNGITTHYWCLKPGYYFIEFNPIITPPVNEVVLIVCGGRITPTTGSVRLVINDNNTCRTEKFNPINNIFVSMISPNVAKNINMQYKDSSYAYVEVVTGSPLSPNSSYTTIAMKPTCDISSTHIPFHLHDTTIQNWFNHQIVLTPIDTSTLTYAITNNKAVTYHYHLPPMNKKIISDSIIIKTNITDTKQYYNMIEHTCLSDGCYTLSAISRIDNHTNSSFSSNTTQLLDSISHYWRACGHLGHVPEYTQLCVEKRINLCYGLNGCLYMKSYAHINDYQYSFITYQDSNSNKEIVMQNDHINGITSLCDLSDGSYNIYIGGGNYYHANDERNTIWICGHTFTLPYTGNLVISHNMTRCSTTRSTPMDMSVGCTRNELEVSQNTIPVNIMKISMNGSGWGFSTRYEISMIQNDLSSYINMNHTVIDDTSINIFPFDENEVQSEGLLNLLNGDQNDTKYEHIDHFSDMNITDVINNDNLSLITDQSETQIALEVILQRFHSRPKKTRKLINTDSSPVTTNNKVIVASGTLENGEFGSDTICLQVHQCYTLSMYSSLNTTSIIAATASTTISNEPDLLWMMCGHIDDISTGSYRFCVTENGCYFV